MHPCLRLLLTGYVVELVPIRLSRLTCLSLAGATTRTPSAFRLQDRCHNC
jgi:hypothetical protein